jgi:hypothetical protein
MVRRPLSRRQAAALERATKKVRKHVDHRLVRWELKLHVYQVALDPATKEWKATIDAEIADGTMEHRLEKQRDVYEIVGLSRP